MYATDPKAAALAWFREAKFGLFMHYGLYSLLERGEWVMFASKMPVAEYAKLMDRFPIILWIGAAVLGKVGGEMMITDPWVNGLLNPPKWAEYASMAFFVVFICALSKWLINRRKSRETLEQAEALPAVGVPVNPEAA